MKDRGLIPGTIALAVVLAFCAFAIYTGVHSLPAANQHYLDIVLGVLVAKFSDVIGFYFGSSRSAERAAQREPVHVPPPADLAKKS